VLAGFVALYPTQGWQDEKTKQDAQLDRIGKVVDSIKGVAVAMDEEVGRICCDAGLSSPCRKSPCRKSSLLSVKH
jgi:hypothetical protein